MALIIALYKLSLGDILTFPSYLFTRVIYGLMPIKLDKLTNLQLIYVERIIVTKQRGHK